MEFPIIVLIVNKWNKITFELINADTDQPVVLQARADTSSTKQLIKANTLDYDTNYRLTVTVQRTGKSDDEELN